VVTPAGPLLLVAGTRPQMVKAAALLPELPTDTVFVRTGQHDDPALAAAQLEALGVRPPDVALGPWPAGRAERLEAMGAALTAVIDERRPRRVVVMGDTDSTVAGTLAARARSLPVAHVEAGARSGEPDLPEEINRKLVDAASDLLFCATPAHAAALGGRPGVHVTGDVMADVLRRYRAVIDSRRPAGGEAYAVLTVHRARTADDPGTLARVLAAVAAAPCAVVYPRHPRAAGAAVPESIAVRPPLSYLDFLGLVAGARFVVTDSGGLQKEAYLLGVPCVTLREATEWGETVAAGWNVLVGVDPERIGTAMRAPPSAAERPELFGDGRAAERIAALLG